MATDDSALQPLRRLIGSWTTAATHPAAPGLVVHGTAEFEWLEGESFLIQRARTDHPDFPDSISIIGITDRDRVDAGSQPGSSTASASMTMHYFDSRGVFRVYEASVDEQVLRFWRDAPGFSQRFVGALADDGTAIVGRWELSRDDAHWDDDLQIRYQRRP